MFKVLDIGDPEWDSLLMTFPPDRRDVHMDWRMLAPYVKTYGWKGGLAVTKSHISHIIQPFLLSNQGQLRHAYNFGGPVSSHLNIYSWPEPDIKTHFVGLDNYAKENGCSDSYCTLNPFLQIDQFLLLEKAGIKTQSNKSTVIVNLNKMKVRGTTRRLANKAQGAGVIVTSHPYLEGFFNQPSESLKKFHDMYNLTMNRNEATENWKFSLQFFKNFCMYNKPLLFCAEYEGKIEAACLVLYKPSISPVAYYHFAASNNSDPSLGISHMMVLAVCEYLKSVGATHLHLGGGRTSDPKDGLLTFKTGFSKTLIPVHTYSYML